ncbi:microtubule-associated serine/threonine-protein kinase 2-like [Panonychus citri]|uniref:microtubule-associated serine/threonine-protein kinase 2-like n=1 Tax=Panonychus citri TaxID=50023 RepID=UPI002306DDE4|nr:microtubule-associated serine/threonine-protein kinase 2-like [Panonychus citri]
MEKQKLEKFINDNRGWIPELVNNSNTETEQDDSDKDNETRKSEKEIIAETTVKLPCEEDYDTIKLISNGAYGGVYLVRHKESRQKFAMKKIDKRSLILRNQVEQAFAERDIMSFTDNPFVVSLYCSFETKRYLCLVMEYVEGGDLATLLKNMGPLPVDLARFYFAETVLAVEYLHNLGIVHRDLKPENLLITALGHIKLTDFGLSKIGLMNLATNICEEHLSKKDTKEFLDKQVCGTPEYIAPEVISHQGYGKPVDWWSMGVILYELLIGCVPFFGETPEELFAHVINDEITWPDDEDWPLPEDAKDVISKLLKQDPLERLGTVGASEVKEHPFFDGLNWDDLLRQKAEFVPQLDNDEDTSYFDTRLDRYNHEIDDSEEQDDTDESSSSMFSSFSSCSPKYHRVYSRIEQELAQEKLMKSSSTSSILDESVQTSSSCLNDSLPPLLNGSIMVSSETSTPVISDKRESNQIKSTESLTPSEENELTVDMEKPQPLQQSTPELSQTESEDFSPKVTRRRKPFMSIKLSCIPRFSISGDNDDRKSDPKLNESNRDEMRSSSQETSEGKDTCTTDSGASSGANGSSGCSSSNSSSSQKTSKSQIPRSSNFPVQLNALIKNHTKGRAVIKSASATGLSLMIPTEDAKNKSCSITSSGGSSTSSRDTSPNREITGPMGQQLKPPIIIRKGPRGFGFTLRAIRVYYGDSDLYTVHHLVLAVENNSPAFEAGLRPNALITHINGEPIQGLLHHQVLQLVLSGGDKINIRTTPLENTSIKTGGRRRHPSSGRMTRRPNLISHKKGAPIKRTDSDKRRRSSLLRKLSSKRASAEIQQLMAASGGAGSSSGVTGGISPPLLTPSRSYQSLNRSFGNSNSNCVNSNIANLVSSEGACESPQAAITTLSTATLASSSSSSAIPRFPRSPPPNRLHCSPSDSSAANSSQSSSPSSSVPNSPASLSHFPHFPRPSTLSGLKQHKVKSFRSPRRKSCGHIPLSPLARTPSPSIQPVSTSSPTRSNCPTSVFPGVHQPGSSSTIQSFILHKNKLTDSSTNTSTQTPSTPTLSSPCLSAPGSKCFSRPKSAEPSSPLLRRALSPDRLLIKRNTDPSKASGPIKHKRHSLGGPVSSPLAISSLPPCTSTKFNQQNMRSTSTNTDTNSPPYYTNQYCSTKEDKMSTVSSSTITTTTSITSSDSNKLVDISSSSSSSSVPSCSCSSSIEVKSGQQSTEDFPESDEKISIKNDSNHHRVTINNLEIKNCKDQKDNQPSSSNLLSSSQSSTSILESKKSSSSSTIPPNITSSSSSTIQSTTTTTTTAPKTTTASTTSSFSSSSSSGKSSESRKSEKSKADKSNSSKNSDKRSNK